MSKVEGGNVGLVAAPTSCAETRLLPAGRTKTMHVDKTGVSPKLKQARVPRRADQDPILAAYKTDGSSTPYKPPTLTTRIGVYGVEPLPKEHKVTLKQLAAVLAEEHQMTKKAGEAMLNDLVVLITKHLKKGERIRIAGLGILQVRKRAARMGRNPATGEAIKIKASKKVAFRAAKELKEAV